MTSTERILSASQPASSNDITPGFPRAALSNKLGAAQSWRANRKIQIGTTGGVTGSVKPRKAQRVLISDVPKPEEDEGQAEGSQASSGEFSLLQKTFSNANTLVL